MPRRRRYTKKRSGSKAISINLAKTAVTLGALGLMVQGMSLSGGDWGSMMMRPYENFKTHWRTILPMAVGVTLLSRFLGRFSPRFGIKNALSVKVF